MDRGPIRVIVIDDSALIRQMLTQMLSSDPGIIVVDTAPDPLVAREKIKLHNPDVVTLDIEMPKMDGLEFLNKIMTLRPMPVVMISSLTQKGAETTLRALESGAVDFVAKPTLDLQAGFLGMKAEIIAKVKMAAAARVQRRGPPTGEVAAVAPRGFLSTEKIIAIGASTGGVEAITAVLTQMPPDCPAIVMTQHMPAQFTSGFARRLDGICTIHVEEARDGQRLLPGHAYLAPGDRHLRVVRSGANYVCAVGGTDPVSGHCPSVDVLFQSVADNVGANAIGVILTGMGRDGTLGLGAMRKAGAPTLGQNEASCVVYGMPRAAFEAGAVETQVPLERMGEALLKICASGGARRVRV